MKEPADVDIAEVIAAAKEAGAAILRLLTAEIHVDAKADDSPVTAADKAADAIVKKRLRALDGEVPIVSEEDTPAERAAARNSRFKWIVDPLDGTKTAIEFAQGEKTYVQFGVHIGLVQDGVPVRGVAFFPAMAGGRGVVYYTGNDGKAWKQTGDAPPEEIGVSKPDLSTDGAKPVLRAAVHYYKDRRPETIGGLPIRAVPGVGGQRLCLAAEGAVDVADMNDIPPKLQKKVAYKQWDLAAAHAVLRAAGGDLVEAATGKTVSYESLTEFKVPGAYAGGRETLKQLGLSQDAATPARAPRKRGPR